MEIGKDMVEKMKKNDLDPNSYICQTLAQDPNLQEGYIALTFTLGVQFLKTVAQKCQTPPMKEMIELPAKKFLSDFLQLVKKMT
ncbi:palmitoyl-protein thioesterase 1-like isoform X2 [Psammomys obesus]|uniref:palmitoyl-protein thioesterase 1-like isoform X2 n=1 Tax=Psammomys obesus TaxID=48139 RepID=UPI002452FDDB|nr:palmitoyl-protein thioesterase 1-like isoform X2 [Psammomys obesus]